MSSNDDGATGPPPEASAIPPLYIQRDDHTYLLMLLFAAHPDLRVDYLAMARASQRMPDPRMWAHLTEIIPRIEPLQRLGAMLREMPSLDDLDPDLNAPAVLGTLSLLEWTPEREISAWRRLLRLQPDTIDQGPLSQELDSVRAQSGLSGTDHSRSSEELPSLTGPVDYHDPGFPPVTEESRGRAHRVEEGGVWVDAALNFHERAAADEERRLDQRIPERRRARRRGGTVTSRPNGASLEQAVSSGQRLREAAEGVETAPDSPDIASTSNEHDVQFSRLSLDDDPQENEAI